MSELPWILLIVALTAIMLAVWNVGMSIDELTAVIRSCQ